MPSPHRWSFSRNRPLYMRAFREGMMFASVALNQGIKQQLNRKSTPFGGRSKSKAGEPPGRRTGTLARSFVVVPPAETGGGMLQAKIGTSVKYARIHEFGGVIKPKNVKAIPVPISREGRLIRARTTGSLRKVKGLFMVKRKGKAPLLARKQGKKKIVPLFVLVKSVKMPKRPYIVPAIKASVQTMARLFGANVKRVLEAGLR